MFSQEIQLTGGRDRFEWLAGDYYWDQEMLTRNGRWQVNEFQKQLMNPDNVFNNPVCNPAGAVLEPTPSTTDNPDNMRFRPAPTASSRTARMRARWSTWAALRRIGRPAGTGAWQTCQQVYYTGVGGAYDTMSRSGQDGWAVFGEATIHLTDRWT